jgi:tungstate transport system substrate-binding protein
MRLPARWNRLLRAAAVLWGALVAASVSAQLTVAPGKSTAGTVTVRCAVIGGMIDTGLWSEVARRFENETGHRIEVVAYGPKQLIVPAFTHGEADLITMHASDTMINLVADGHGIDPQPWARNDLILVGPPSDPAGVRGEKDAVVALQRIVTSGARLLMHASLGTNEVLHDLLTAGGIELDPGKVISLPVDRQREMLGRAQAEQAYTLVGRIPFLKAKIARHDMVIMVQGDPRLRRPYVVVVARPDPARPANHSAAKALASYLRQPRTQDWLAEFGKGQLDDAPLFFPVVVGAGSGKRVE